MSIRKNVFVLGLATALALGVIVVRSEDDDDVEPGPTTVNKNGFEIDERSVGRDPLGHERDSGNPPGTLIEPRIAVPPQTTPALTPSRRVPPPVR